MIRHSWYDRTHEHIFPRNSDSIIRERCHNMNPVSHKTYRLMALPLVAVLAGCGFHSASPAHHKPHVLRSSSSVSPSTAPSPSPSTQPSSSPSVTPSSSSPTTSQSKTSPSPSQTPPPPPGAGSYRELRIFVQHAQPEGTRMVNGQRLNIYLLTLKVENPTSGMIGLALDDVSVQANHRLYSWNDFSLTGLTKSNSLFGYPPTPKDPDGDVTQILPGRPLTGDITVQVPSASQYQLVFNGTSTPTSSGAAFSP